MFYCGSNDSEEIKQAVTGNLFDFQGEGVKFTVKLFNNFLDKHDRRDAPSYVPFRTNEGFEETKGFDNNMDTVVCEINLGDLFRKFNNQDLDTFVYKNRLLKETEKQTIRHFLNFKNLAPIEMSPLTSHMISLGNYNFYAGSFPTAAVTTNPISLDYRRYREYIFANNSAQLIYLDQANEAGHDFDKFESKHPCYVLQNRYNDIQNGSSGTGAYDSNGKFIGIEVRGHVSSSSF